MCVFDKHDVEMQCEIMMFAYVQIQIIMDRIVYVLGGNKPLSRQDIVDAACRGLLTCGEQVASRDTSLCVLSNMPARCCYKIF